MRDAHELMRLYCRDGSAAAFREFYRAQAPRLWRYLIARGSTPEDAYDLMAEAFARYIEHVCRDWSAPVALLYRIAANLKIDAWRRGRASPIDPAGADEAPEAAQDPEPAENVHLRELMGRLPAGEQNLLLLRYWIGLSHKETAQALDLPEGTVRRQCSEALEKLRRIWGEHDE